MLPNFSITVNFSLITSHAIAGQESWAYVLQVMLYFINETDKSRDRRMNN
ncbi:MAG: hypothetical protein ACKO2V_18870 [Snowella sp.]